MIASLRGTVRRLTTAAVVLEVGGVGLEVAVPASVLEEIGGIGQSLHLHTRLIVREDALSLYGFSTLEQRELFDLLLQVNGVGPRLALAVLSHLAPESLRAAVAGGQLEILTRVPGIGRKTAEKIAFQLKDRLAAPPAGAAPAPRPGDLEVLQALAALGYSQAEAQAALSSIPADSPDPIEERIRLALRSMSRP